MTLGNDIKRPIFLSLDTMFKDALQHPTSIRMTRKRHDVIQDIIDHKIDLLSEKFSPSPILGSQSLLSFRAQHFDTFLDDMVAVLIMNTGQDTLVELHQQLRQILLAQSLKCLLHHTATGTQVRVRFAEKGDSQQSYPSSTYPYICMESGSISPCNVSRKPIFISGVPNSRSFCTT